MEAINITAIQHKTNQEKDEHCEGCYGKCSIPYANKNGKCPCSNCIIKVMCDITCDIWLRWYRKESPI